MISNIVLINKLDKETCNCFNRRPSGAQLLSAHFLFHFRCKVSSTYLCALQMRHAFQSKKHSWWSVSLSTTIYRLRGTNRQNGFYPIFSALIREITRHILYLFHSQNYQLHADSKGTFIMVRDRMPDLRASRNNSSTFGRGFLQDVHLQIAHNKKLKELLDEAEEIRTLIQLIVENVSIVKNLHNNILSHTNKDFQKELETRTCTISQTAFRVQRKLRDMGKGITVIERDDLTVLQDGPAYTRIRMLQYTTMLQLFSEIMEDYNASLLKYHDKCLLLLQQQRSLLRRQVTSVELDYMLDAQETSLFVDNILEDSKVARQQLSDIKSRHNDVLKLEKSLTEVRDMFEEIAFLIEKQGEQINNIEYFANKTTNNIDGGRVQLRKSEQQSHTYRKRKIKIGIIISVIVIIFLLFIIASL